MTYVALWRNVNVGQRGHPTAAQLCALMTEAGAVDARSFQSNGTVVFEAASLTSAEQIGAEAATRLAALSPADRDVRVVSMERIRELVHEFGPAADVDRREITFHPGDAISLDSEAVRAAVARIRHSMTIDGDDAGVTRQWQLALRAKIGLRATVRLPDGSERVFDLEPTGVGAGRVRGRDREADVERTLPVASITALEPLDA